MRTFGGYDFFSRSYKFGHVLYDLDLRTHFNIHYIILHLCDARQPAYCWCGVYSAFKKHSIFCSGSTLLTLFEQAIALFNMIRSILFKLYLKKINMASLELHLMSFQRGLCRFSRFVLDIFYVSLLLDHCSFPSRLVLRLSEFLSISLKKKLLIKSRL